MSGGVIEYEHWQRFEERTKEAWRHVVRQHGFNPSDVAFPLVIDGPVMVVTEYQRNEQGHIYLNAERDGPAVKVHEVRLQTEVGLPAICRKGDA